MEGNNKLVVYAVVALVVGAIIGIGAGYAMWSGNSDNGVDESEYHYYLYFGADSQKNGWYSATGADAGVAFENAMKSAGMDYTFSNLGYVQSIDGVDNGAGWYIAQYLYSETSTEAAQGSVAGEKVEYGILTYSNGWMLFNGYGTNGEFQLGSCGSNIIFMSAYNVDWSAASPVSVTEWMTTGPFATA